MQRFLALLFLIASSGAGHAVELSLPPNAILTREVVEQRGTYFLPTGPYADGVLPVIEIEGRIVQQAWRIKGQALTTLQVLSPLQAQLRLAKFEVLFDCVGQECGGFDFRFGTRVMAAPDMFVDLFDYRFLAARHGAEGAGADYVTILASYAGNTGYVQIIHVAPQDVSAISVSSLAPVAGVGGDVTSAAGAGNDTVPNRSGLQAGLTQQGHVVLADIEFASGSSILEQGPFASLRELAEFLNADRSRRIALVGHTDAVGELEPNVTLSRRRAASVLERLAVTYGVPRTQLEAGGMGYLSPVASNLTAEGREANRRVEAVLLSAE